MLNNANAFSSFAVKDTKAAKAFYEDVLGLEVSEVPEMNLLRLQLAGGFEVMVYPKPDHQPATYTVLNFQVSDIDKAVDGLVERGGEITRFDGFETDEKGIVRDSRGPAIAWFTDPSGNIMAVMQN